MSEQDPCAVRARWTEALAGEVLDWELRELDQPSFDGDAFEGELSFGTGGIRSPMGVGPNRLNRLTVGRITQGLCRWLGSLGTTDARVALVYDTRVHSRDFAHVAAGVFAANGVRVQTFGSAQPTPLLSYAVRAAGCAAGVCITASHNPREWNGYRVYDSHGVQATDAMARAIQTHIGPVNPFVDVRRLPFEDAVSLGMVEYADEALLRSYEEAVLSQRVGVDCKGLRVVYSPLGGTGLPHALRLLHAIGAECSLVECQAKTDGLFSGCPRPNPENPDAMAPGMRQLLLEQADLLVATDPDADRVGVACLHEGVPRIIAGDDLGLLLFDFVAGQSRQEGGEGLVAVTTVVGSPLAGAIAAAHGVELRKTLTGFKYVGEQVGRVLQCGGRFLFGFEESDGYLKGTYVRDKDGLEGMVLACELAAHYKARGMDLVDALECLHGRYGCVLGRHLTLSCGGEVRRASPGELLTQLRATPPSRVGGLRVVGVLDYQDRLPMPVAGCVRAGAASSAASESLPSANVLEWCLAGGSSVIVRPSGTEPKFKAYVFAKGDGYESARHLLDTLCADVADILAAQSPSASA